MNNVTGANSLVVAVSVGSTQAPGFMLQRAQKLENYLWTDVPEHVTRLELALAETKEFFRLVRPY
jgi:hypothetical protein